MTKVMLAGGATGGHLYPGLAVAEHWKLSDPQVSITFVGTARGLEEKVLGQSDFHFVAMKTPTLMDKKGVMRYLAGLKLPMTLLGCLLLLIRSRVQLVLGLGGYSAGPPLLAGWLLGIPTAIMEQNAVPGKTNQWLGRVTKKIFVWFQKAGSYFPSSKIFRSGIPVRREIRQVASHQAARAPHSDQLTLVILGGSQGARSVNELILAALPQLTSLGRRLKIIHQTGPWTGAQLKEGYLRFGLEAVVVPFIEDMASVYGKADLVVARAGAGTLAELAATGRPSILIPYPYAASGHQQANAAEFFQAGASVVQAEAAATGESLGREIVALLLDPKRRDAMSRAALKLDRPNAAADIVEQCMKLICA